MRRARGTRLLAVIGVAIVALAAAGCGGKGSRPSGGGSVPAKKAIKIGVVYDAGGREKSAGAAAAGLARVRSSVKADVKELEAAADESQDDKYSRLKLLCQGGYNPVIAVGFGYLAGSAPGNGPLARAAKECPNTRFAVIDAQTWFAPNGGANTTAITPADAADNIARLTFAEEQGSFLVGAAAALKSKTGVVGFVGGCAAPSIRKFEAGYSAGARAVNPSVRVLSSYLSTPADSCSGFNDAAKGEIQAGGQYEAGADIVYHAAGSSGTGVFKAAKAKSKLAIGVDGDQYQTEPSGLRDVILTSMIKRIDIVVHEFVSSVVDGKFTTGTTVFDLRTGGIGYATSGGKVDDIRSRLDAFKAEIISGSIKVPTEPTT